MLAYSRECPDTGHLALCWRPGEWTIEYSAYALRMIQLLSITILVRDFISSAKYLARELIILVPSWFICVIALGRLDVSLRERDEWNAIARAKSESITSTNIPGLHPT